MKKILFATDFSPAATQAMNYVIELARKTGAEIYILNAYLVPAVEFTVDMPIYSEMRREEKLNSERHLKDIIHLISNIKDDKGNFLKYKTVSELGDPVSAIARHVEHEQPDIVIIGNTGIDDPYRWYASAAAEIIKEITTPILIAPSTARPYSLKHILYAAELVKDDAEAITKLVDFAKIVGAWITVLHIVDSKNEESAHLFKTLQKEITSTTDYNKMSWRSAKNDNLQEAISELVANDNIDLISLLRHPRPALDSLFHKSLTKALIKASPTPLLVIH